MRKKLAILLCAGLLVTSTPVNAYQSNIPLYTEYVEEIAEQYNICPELIEAVIYYESRWDADAVSDMNCVGLMQVSVAYSKERMEKLGVTDLTDPYSNILVGTDLLVELSGKYEVYDALAAYNLGENSKTFKKVLNGASWEYSEEILEMSAQLEREHGK